MVGICETSLICSVTCWEDYIVGFAVDAGSLADLGDESRIVRKAFGVC